MTTTRRITARGFSLIEVLLVLAIISIMAAMVINAFSNASQDSRVVVARQQQASLQSAVNNWTSGQIGRIISVDTTGDSVPDTDFRLSVEQVRVNWWTKPIVTTAANTRTARDRLDLVKDYLDEDTYEHFKQNSPSGDKSKIVSNAMKKTDRYLELPLWDPVSATKRYPYPKVDLYQP